MTASKTKRVNRGKKPKKKKTKKKTRNKKTQGRASVVARRGDYMAENAMGLALSWSAANEHTALVVEALSLYRVRQAIWHDTLLADSEMDKA